MPFVVVFAEIGSPRISSLRLLVCLKGIIKCFSNILDKSLLTSKTFVDFPDRKKMPAFIHFTWDDWRFSIVWYYRSFAGHLFFWWVSLRRCSLLISAFPMFCFLSACFYLLFKNFFSSLVDYCWVSLTVEQICLSLRALLNGTLSFNEDGCSDLQCKKLWRSVFSWQTVAWRRRFLSIYTFVSKNELASFKMLKSNLRFLSLTYSWS